MMILVMVSLLPVSLLAQTPPHAEGVDKVKPRYVTGPRNTASQPPEDPGFVLWKAYSAALRAQVRENWTRPAGMVMTQPCPLLIHQVPGGMVIDAEALPECPYDKAQKDSIVAAVLKSQPLPYRGFEPVFSRFLVLIFQED